MLYEGTLPVQPSIDKACLIPQTSVNNMQPNEIMGAVRPIHMFNAFTKIIVGHIDRSTHRAEAHYSKFGVIPGRRREEAIASQNINRFKCMQNNVSYAQKCFDVGNAFYTVDRDKPNTWIEGTKQDWYSFARNARQHIVENSTAIIEGADDTLILPPNSGVPPGLCGATAMFTCLPTGIEQILRRNCTHNQHGQCHQPNIGQHNEHGLYKICG